MIRWPELHTPNTCIDLADADYATFAAGIAEVAALEGCPQHPAFHGEGDVAAHTAMVLEAMRADTRMAGFDAAGRRELVVAAVLHDIGKPAVTKLDENGIWRAPNHAHVGAVQARALLWRAGVPADARERICALVDHHLRPFHLLERTGPDAKALAATLSLTAGCDRLAILANADGCGRIADDRDALVDAVGMFAQWCDELGCLTGAYPFASERSRIELLRNPSADWSWDPWDNTRCEVTVMVGLPGSGKSHWVAEHGGGLPIVSLDDIRVRLGVHPAADQGHVVAAGRREAVRLLGSATSFVWDATNMTRDRRRRIIDTALAYHARVRIVAVECDEVVLRERNRRRARPVPDNVIDTMIRRWEAPTLAEAHQLDVVGM